MRYALDSAVLPLASETLPIAEEMRRQAINKFVDTQGGQRYGSDWSWEEYKAKKLSVTLTPVLLGKDVEGNRRVDDHQHAFWLPADEDGDGRLDHLTVVAQEGFDRDDMRALDRIRGLKRDEGAAPLRVLLVGMGRLDEFYPLPLGRGSPMGFGDAVYCDKAPESEREETGCPRTTRVLDCLKQYRKGRDHENNFNQIASLRCKSRPAECGKSMQV